MNPFYICRWLPATKLIPFNVSRSRIHERIILLRYMRKILSVLRVEFYTIFTLQTSFKPILLEGGGGGLVDSKEENSQDFCPNYVQEFGLRT
jgi:hypothetical protein